MAWNVRWALQTCNAATDENEIVPSCSSNQSKADLAATRTRYPILDGNKPTTAGIATHRTRCCAARDASRGG